jgi:DNA-binding HxlR family transcriptional regulator
VAPEDAVTRQFDAILDREADRFGGAVPHVEYALTAHGARLVPVIDALGDWFEAAPRTGAVASREAPGPIPA